MGRRIRGHQGRRKEHGADHCIGRGAESPRPVPAAEKSEECPQLPAPGNERRHHFRASPSAAAGAGVGSAGVRPTFAASAAASYFSTFSPSGGGGRGRGRGFEGPSSHLPRPPGDSADDHDELPGLGHGHGKPPIPASPVLPSFSSWISNACGGRGRGAPHGGLDDSLPKRQLKKPIFFTRDEGPPPDRPGGPVLPPSVAPAFLRAFPGSGRGKSDRPRPGPAPADLQELEENRHLRRRDMRADARGGRSGKFGREEDGKKMYGRGGDRGRGGRGRGLRGRGRGRGFYRDRGVMGKGRGDRSKDEDEDEGESDSDTRFLGDNADGERLEKRLGEEKINKLVEGFEEVSSRVMPSLLDEIYLEAVHTNNMIEYEPEYLVDFDNPDIDEKPPIPLTDALEKMKPFLMAYEGIQNQEEWEEIIEDLMKKLPAFRELIDYYCGPDRVTAKQQQEELQRVASTLPNSAPASVKKFTDRAVLSLQSNPGWGRDKKCQFMDRLVWEVAQQYK